MLFDVVFACWELLWICIFCMFFELWERVGGSVGSQSLKMHREILKQYVSLLCWTYPPTQDESGQWICEPKKYNVILVVSFLCLVLVSNSWLVLSNIFYFHPYLGKMNPFWLINFNWLGSTTNSQQHVVFLFLWVFHPLSFSFPPPPQNVSDMRENMQAVSGQPWLYLDPWALPLPVPAAWAPNPRRAVEIFGSTVGSPYPQLGGWTCRELGSGVGIFKPWMEGVPWIPDPWRGRKRKNHGYY